jgi:hypothetical protein
MGCKFSILTREIGAPSILIKNLSTCAYLSEIKIASLFFGELSLTFLKTERGIYRIND